MMKGLKASEETKRKISEAHKKRFQNGAKSNNFGKKTSIETRKKMSESRKRLIDNGKEK